MANFLLEVAVLVTVLVIGVHSSLNRCNREPPGFYKTPGDNGFKIQVEGSPQKYVPGKSYTDDGRNGPSKTPSRFYCAGSIIFGGCIDSIPMHVTLQGFKTHLSDQKFTNFIIVVEPSTEKPNILLKDVGTFQLPGDGMTKFSDECQNAITQSSSLSKSSVQVMWKAPRSGSGCVKFKVTLQETGNNWYMDDGNLTKELCEEVQENPDEQGPSLHKCCACDEAKYDVTFQGLWSRNTHPKDFPDKWSTHFSDIIGASHSEEFTMWEYGGTATEGLKKVAESGITRDIESEMKLMSKSIKTIIKARGLWFPNLNGSAFAVVRVDNIHHLVSLVSMLGPSPDWIVGVSRLELCQEDCTWMTQKTLNLYPWDAGTDNGITYMSPNSPTEPRDRIRQITSTYPNNEESPFYEPNGVKLKPLAKLVLTRQRVYKKSCDAKSLPTDDSFEEDPIIPDEPDVPDDPRMECAVTDWSDYTECSVTCGKGVMSRTRRYRMENKAAMFLCNTQLKEMDMCVGVAGSCLKGKNEDPIKCATGPWSDWSECDSHCGIGFRQRTRKFIERKAFKTCQVHTTEKEKCMSGGGGGSSDDEGCGNADPVDPQCPVTQWSEWSPCSVSCGKGLQERLRFYPLAKSRSMCSLNLRETRPCTAEKPDCNFDLKEAMEICNQPREFGQCRGSFHRWYYDTTKRACIQFMYSGCRGNKNNFETAEFCNQVCEIMKGGDMINLINPNPVILTYAMRDSSVHVDTQHGLVCVPIDSPIVAQQTNNVFKNMQKAQAAPVDCMLTSWSHWSRCSSECGGGTRYRERNIKVHPQNGGKSCGKTYQEKRCNKKKCQK